MSHLWMLSSAALSAKSLPADGRMHLAVAASVWPLVHSKIRVRHGTQALEGSSVIEGARCAPEATDVFGPIGGWIGVNDLAGLELSRTLVIGAVPAMMLLRIASASRVQDCNAALGELSRVLNGWGLSVADGAVAEGFLTQDDDMVWTSFSARLRRYVGLHFDCWDALDNAHRDVGTLRCCVNLGQSERAFVMAPFSAQHLVKTLTTSGVDVSVGLAPAAMLAFSDLPLIEVPHLPGQIYVAPTENVLHDGYRADTSTPDRTFAIRAHLSVDERYQGHLRR
jgi:hypothetical protein